MPSFNKLKRPGTSSSRRSNNSSSTDLNERLSGGTTPTSLDTPTTSGELESSQTDAEMAKQIQQAVEKEEEAQLAKDASLDSNSSDGMTSKGNWKEAISANYATSADQEDQDEEIRQGVEHFFNGDFSKAEATFLRRYDSDSLSGLALGAMTFMKAGMTLDEEDIVLATKRLHQAARVAEEQNNLTRPSLGVLGSVGKMLTGLFGGGSGGKGKGGEIAGEDVISHPDWYNSELRNNVIRAESYLLVALLQFLQESLMSYVKAGLNLRRGYSQYDSVWKIVQGLKDPVGQVDRNTLCGIYFGIGSCNLILSILPSKILKLIAILGISGEKERGFTLLDKAVRLEGLRSPLALVLLFVYYIMLTSFCPEILAPKNLPRIQSLLKETKERYPEGVIFAYFHGRQDRQERRLDAAIQAFTSIMTRRDEKVDKTAGSESDLSLACWKAIGHMCEYDLALTYMYALKFREAAQTFRQISESGYWSPGTLRYLEAVCWDAAGDWEKAQKAYEEAPQLVTRTFGGRVISSERYILNRCELYRRQKNPDGPDTLHAWEAALEVIGIWNGFGCMEPSGIQWCWDRVQTLEKEGSGEGKIGGGGDEGVVGWVRGILQRERGDLVGAAGTLVSVVQKGCQRKGDAFVQAFAAYDRAIVAYLAGEKDAAKTWMIRAGHEGGSEHFFEYRLALRIHLAQLSLEEEKKEEKEKGRRENREQEEEGTGTPVSVSIPSSPTP
ncbi:hypothetical protein BJ684DRAFT_15224 [Piptocephalis cylindrospora]|uniref:Outer membrane protein Iml2/Tetratricopeptide repeat protein 39 n=1 Tax=Piptocephalis cylindrospora TaxID=1907219 RepID=A0A4P9Y825_9FUNG|nr:hypothetical protein BJ684DRAFT_15224 [Piptocephalis cylindrospora]|eukprot:RKP14451.1 hypothetical protein BJ684DRAFT_15224 [Piptocephalis cylindrospora]